jgi:alkylhydroperoxidase family enzyme
MLQYLIVGLIVAAAVAYSAWTFLPAAWRRAGAARLAHQAHRTGLDAGKAQALRTRLERTAACGECANCKGCGPARSTGPTAQG